MNEQEIEFFVEECDSKKRIDLFLSEKADNFTRSHIQKLIEQECILVNNKVISKSYKLNVGDVVYVEMPDNNDIDVIAQNIPLDIVYEDDDLLVVNKPKGMVVHPAPGNLTDTLVNALLFHCQGSLSGINGVNRPGIVHRIDKDTSGLLVVAKSDRAHSGLAEQFAAHSIKREYYAIVYGKFKGLKGTVNAPIGRHPILRKKMAITPTNSKNAVTHYEVIEEFDGFSLIKCHLETGRTHQIRVHMSSLGHPLAGDEVYGPKKVIKSLCGQCLHAKVLGFIHPVTKQEMIFDSQLPEYFLSFVKKLRNKADV